MKSLLLASLLTSFTAPVVFGVPAASLPRLENLGEETAIDRRSHHSPKMPSSSLRAAAASDSGFLSPVKRTAPRKTLFAAALLALLAVPVATSTPVQAADAKAVMKLDPKSGFDRRGGRCFSREGSACGGV